MARSGWRKPESQRRLSDLVSVGLLTRVFPPELVDEVIGATGRREKRHRALPARMMVYFAIAMALDTDGSYRDVLSLMVDGLAWADADTEVPKVPSASAIFQARARLGVEPLRALFERTALPLAHEGDQSAFLAGRRVIAIDGTSLDVADTPANDEHFGRPGVNRGEGAAFPQARVVALAECGSHAILDAAIGVVATGENTLARELMGRLEPGMLLLADRGFCGYPLWSAAVASGADLLWRAKSTMKPRHIKTLEDGSWLAQLHPSGNAGRNSEGLPIRVIEYEIDDGRSRGAYRLFTTVLDPAEAPAEDLAVAYAQRWEIELVFDELKTHQRGPRTVLRSKSPQLVEQEIWGQLCCHYAIRTLMFEAANDAHLDPDRVSFTTALRITRRSLSQARDFSP